MGYNVEAEVQGIGTYRIRLINNFELDLVHTPFIPTTK